MWFFNMFKWPFASSRRWGNRMKITLILRYRYTTSCESWTHNNISQDLVSKQCLLLRQFSGNPIKITLIPRYRYNTSWESWTHNNISQYLVNKKGLLLRQFSFGPHFWFFMCIKNRPVSVTISPLMAVEERIPEMVISNAGMGGVGKICSEFYCWCRGFIAPLSDL